MTLTARCSLLLVLLLGACAPHPVAPPTATESAAHPLSGQIWDVRARHRITLQQLEQRLGRARYALLGEVHDNPEHHRLRRELIAALLRDGHRPAIVMEQFDRDHQAALLRAQREPAPTPESLKIAGQLNERGWHWPFYEPIIRIALDHRLPVSAANLSRADAFRVSTAGAAAVLGPTTVRDLRLDQPLPDVTRRRLEQIIDEGHCRKAPPEILPGIVAAQRARDALMAQALQTHATAVLIAGNGHVRRDFGVPHYLAHYPQGDNVAVVGFLEVSSTRNMPGDYYHADSPEYDYIVFTRRNPRPDPCQDIRFKPR